MTPHRKLAILDALQTLLSFCEEIEVEKSCNTCTFYEEKRCTWYDSVPPETVVNAGCESWCLDPESPPF